MQKIILFFSCEPGGAEVLIPVIKLVEKETPYKTIVLSYGLGSTRFEKKNIEYIKIGQIEKGNLTVVQHFRPNLIVTSATSLPEYDMSEKFLWHNARLVGVPTIAFLDQWQNYAARFSGAIENERLAYQPDYINCINEIGKLDMINEGIDNHRLVQFGHPYLSSIKQSAKQIDINEMRKFIGVDPSENVALFASEAIQENYGSSRGYDQYDALRLFMDKLSHSPDKLRPLIKLHPKDTLEGYQRILCDYAFLMPIVIRNELSSIECIQVANEVYGMTSILLIEAFALGKKVVSIQPGLSGEDPMVLSRFGYIQKITNSNFMEHFEEVAFQTSSVTRFEFSFKEYEFLSFLDAILR